MVRGGWVTRDAGGPARATIINRILLLLLIIIIIINHNNKKKKKNYCSYHN